MPASSPDARAAAACLLALLLGACGEAAQTGGAEPLHVAVASNFAATQQALAERFTASTGVEVVTTLGSTGQLYAQIRSGAPFHVLLAADRERPRRLEGEGGAVPGSRFSYAEGRLVLFGPGLDSVRTGGGDLVDRAAHVALANPETAPYGAAARDVLTRLDLLEILAPRLVRGESVSQAEGFVRSGAAELGFVGLSQVIREAATTYWLIPSALHRPILQDAVLLRAGEAHPAARAYLDFLRSADARRIIEDAGYALPASGAP
jgi:molybdate transport system substrate-binding protein